jgi:pantoate--beta-alanine ligase
VASLSSVSTRARRLQSVRTAAEVRAAVSDWHARGENVGFVPTMGNLHDGHTSLTALAAAECDRTVASIFVNPTQFGPNEDFAAYPRTLAEDTARLEAAGTVDLLFVPDEKEIYPYGLDQAARVVLPPLSRELDGASRPGHFDGVASVVYRLLNIVMPDVLVLGQKDYQQVILLERMIRDLRLPVRVRVGETRREPDGLAMSSRNRYLDAAERRRAPELHAALARLGAALRAGRRDHGALEREAVEELARAGFRPDYVEIRRAADLAKPKADDRPDDLVVLGAAWLGRARLIDNLRI